jgi:hypothetical protein
MSQFKLLSYVFLNVSISAGPVEIEISRKTYDRSLTLKVITASNREIRSEQAVWHKLKNSVAYKYKFPKCT